MALLSSGGNLLLSGWAYHIKPPGGTRQMQYGQVKVVSQVAKALRGIQTHRWNIRWMARRYVRYAPNGNAFKSLLWLITANYGLYGLLTIMACTQASRNRGTPCLKSDPPDYPVTGESSPGVLVIRGGPFVVGLGEPYQTRQGCPTAPPDHLGTAPWAIVIRRGLGPENTPYEQDSQIFLQTTEFILCRQECE